MSSVSLPRAQETAWFPKLENEPVCSHFYCITSYLLAHCLFGRFFLAFLPLYSGGSDATLDVIKIIKEGIAKGGKNMSSYALGFQDIDKTKLMVVGGKGANLGELSK
ncbi:MAG: hypothetical protein ABI456_19865, partial [Ktedonobacteraceae bacterium]